MMTMILILGTISVYMLGRRDGIKESKKLSSFTEGVKYLNSGLDDDDLKIIHHVGEINLLLNNNGKNKIKINEDLNKCIDKYIIDLKNSKYEKVYTFWELRELFFDDVNKIYSKSKEYNTIDYKGHNFITIYNDLEFFISSKYRCFWDVDEYTGSYKKCEDYNYLRHKVNFVEHDEENPIVFKKSKN